ncbi:MAG: hypothetical protein AAFU79_28420 [Myxococcota bacterium]
MSDTLDREAFEALRTRTAFSLDGGVCLKISGPDAFDLLDEALPSSLFLKDAELRQSLFLRQDGTPFADVLVARSDEEYLLWIDGPSLENSRAHLDRAGREGLDVEIQDLRLTHGVLSLHGPYAWELLAHLYGEDLAALPYLRLFELCGGWCLRAGRTGEFGYHLLLPHADIEAAKARLQQDGDIFGLREVGPRELEQAALENWFYSPTRYGLAQETLTSMGTLTPLELQLQWRVRSSKRFLGSEAVAARRAEGARFRLTAFVGPDAQGQASTPGVGSPVELDGQTIGRIFSAGRSPLFDRAFGAALLALPHAFPDQSITAQGVRLRTVAPPVIRNQSLYTSPSRHSWLRQELPTFPAWLALGER